MSSNSAVRPLGEFGSGRCGGRSDRPNPQSMPDSQSLPCHRFRFAGSGKTISDSGPDAMRMTVRPAAWYGVRFPALCDGSGCGSVPAGRVVPLIGGRMCSVMPFRRPKWHDYLPPEETSDGSFGGQWGSVAGIGTANTGPIRLPLLSPACSRVVMMVGLFGIRHYKKPCKKASSRFFLGGGRHA